MCSAESAARKASRGWCRAVLTCSPMINGRVGSTRLQSWIGSTRPKCQHCILLYTRRSSHRERRVRCKIVYWNLNSRSLTKKSLGKKNDEEDCRQYTYMGAFSAMLEEINSLAAQHEVISERMKENIVSQYLVDLFELLFLGSVTWKQGAISSNES